MITKEEKKQIKKDSLINILINKYKKEGYIVETEVKEKNNLKYFEVRKSKRLCVHSKPLLSEIIFFDMKGQNVLSSVIQEHYKLK